MHSNKIFLWIALATGLLLLIPFGLMVFHIPLYDPGSGYEVIQWSPFDFAVMGLLIFGTGSLFVSLARIIAKKYWAMLAVVITLLFLWLWAELAVGIFTTWGS